MRTLTPLVAASQTFFCDMYITSYNVVFTALPVIVRAIMETDLPERVADGFPELYRFGAADEYFSGWIGFKTGLLSTYHAVVVTGVPILLFYSGGGGTSADGMAGDLWSGSVASFVYIVPLVHLQIYLDTWNWTSLVAVTYGASLAVFVAAVAVYDNIASSVQGAWHSVVLSPTFWLGFWLSTVACLMPHIANKWCVHLVSCVCRSYLDSDSDAWCMLQLPGELRDDKPGAHSPACAVLQQDPGRLAGRRQGQRDVESGWPAVVREH